LAWVRAYLSPALEKVKDLNNAKRRNMSQDLLHVNCSSPSYHHALYLSESISIRNAAK